MPFQLAAPDLARLNRKLNEQQKALSGPGSAERMRGVANECVAIDVPAAVVADLGDLSMSHWWRANPIELKAEVHERTRGDEVEFVVRPRPRTRGPWRVMESGRRSLTKGEFRVAGKRVRKRDGAVVDKRRRVKRSMGATAGEDTWSDATTLMERRMRRKVPITIEQTFKHIWKG